MQTDMEPMFGGNSGQKENDNFDVDRLYSILQEYWMSIVICIVFSMLVGIVYLRYATPVYKAHAKVLVKSEQRDAANGALLEELGMGGSKNNVENEVEIFKSRILMQKAIENLHLNIQYYVPGKVITTNLYNDGPFRLVPLFVDSVIKSTYSYTFRINTHGKFETEINGKRISGQYGDIIDFPFGKAIIESNPLAGHLYDETYEFIVVFESSEAIVDRYLGNLTVELINKQVSVINLFFQDESQERAEDLLNRLIQEYQIASINDKNLVAEGTLEFIKGRLGDIGTELSEVEKDIEGFKKENRILDIESQSKLLLDNTGDNIKELTQSEVQLKVLESLDKYVNTPANSHRMMPATLITQDVTLAKLIEEYNSLLARRQRMLMSYTESSPFIEGINAQVEELRGGIRNYISSLKRGYEVTVGELKQREGAIGSRLQQVPEKERIFLEFARKQQIMQELYLFLLKKREETAISKSATVSNLKIVDPAKRTGGPVAPVRSRIYLMALVIGIVVPGLRIAVKEIFNNRVVSKSEIEKLTHIPILAEIAHANDTVNPVIVTRDSKTVIAEQFRALRTNMQFLLTNDSNKIILVSSSMSGEGKSFISLNLASAIALSGKKVVLMELDLRKPKISRALNLKNETGFSSYIIGHSNIESIVLPSGIIDDLYVISSGPIPPNPAELLMLPKVEQMFTELRHKFDYVIIDTAPLGLVTDAQLLSKIADATLYVMRQGYTYKQQVKSANDIYRLNKMPHMGIVLNDVKLNRNSEYGYGYSEGKGYFDDDVSSKKISKLFKRKI